MVRGLTLHWKYKSLQNTEHQEVLLWTISKSGPKLDIFCKELSCSMRILNINLQLIWLEIEIIIMWGI